MSAVEVRLVSGGLVGFTQIMWTVGVGVSQLLAFVLAKSDIVGIRIILTQLLCLALATWACACSTRASSRSKRKP